MSQSINSSDSDEVQPFMSDQASLQDRAAQEELPNLTAVTSTSLAGLVAEDVLDSISVKNQQAGEDGEHPQYGSTLEHTISSVSAMTQNGGFLVPKTELIVTLSTIFSLTFLASLDATILSTLITDIASDLNAIPYISWIATSYLLSTSIVQPLGKLSDIFGRKPMLLVCIFVFTVGCLQCAMTPTTAGFVLGRFLAGASGGLNTLGTIVMSDLIPLRKRGVFQGIANMFYALGSATGGTIGGWIAHRWGWRTAFWFQVPIGIICFFLIFFFLHLPPLTAEGSQDSFRNKLKRIDVTGISLLALTLFFFILLTSFQFANWATLLVVVLVFLTTLIGFIYTELVACDDPIVPLSLLGNRSVFGCSMSNFFGTMFCFVVLYYFPVYLSTVVGLNTEQIGIRALPAIVAMSISSIGSGYYMKATGKYSKFSIIMNSLSVIGIGLMLYFCYPFDLARVPGAFGQFTLNILPTTGYASMLTVTLLALIAAVPPQHQASVTSIQYAFRGIGSVLGTAIGSRIFTSTLLPVMTKKLSKVRPKDLSNKEFAKLLDKVIHNSAYIRKGAPAWAMPAMEETYGIACWYAYVFALCCTILCLCSTFLIKEYKLYSSVKRNR